MQREPRELFWGAISWGIPCKEFLWNPRPGNLLANTQGVLWGTPSEYLRELGNLTRKSSRESLVNLVGVLQIIPGESLGNLKEPTGNFYGIPREPSTVGIRIPKAFLVNPQGVSLRIPREPVWDSQGILRESSRTPWKISQEIPSEHLWNSWEAWSRTRRRRYLGAFLVLFQVDLLSYFGVNFIRFAMFA